MRSKTFIIVTIIMHMGITLPTYSILNLSIVSSQEKSRIKHNEKSSVKSVIGMENALIISLHLWFSNCFMVLTGDNLKNDKKPNKPKILLTICHFL